MIGRHHRGGPMPATDFVNSLLEHGRVRVSAELMPLADLGDAVEQLDATVRSEMAWVAPSLRTETAQWALTLLYRGCQFLTHRHLEASLIDQAFAVPRPWRPSADVCYSADLAFRFLPDLLALARGIAVDDPLVANLRRLSTRWPLSSVGVGDLGPVDVSPFIDNDSCKMLYVDRIILRSDVSRLADTRVREAVLASVGNYPELAPEIAAAATAGIETAQA